MTCTLYLLLQQGGGCHFIEFHLDLYSSERLLVHFLPHIHPVKVIVTANQLIGVNRFIYKVSQFFVFCLGKLFEQKKYVFICGKSGAKFFQLISLLTHKMNRRCVLCVLCG